ncbi:GNAT family N-acetyltransferase [Nitratireductor sp. GISD-1A_MAKvit]|uniref:GNAT family N-acetyltransferase n=1 Tax=Nitratireductor sp. GISD-1A_MAKvit TaxID=3234198 RepID=UPI0034653A7B
MPVETRPPKKGELDALVAIENAAFSGDRLSRRSLRHLIGTASAIACVAEEGGRITGYAVALSRRNSRKVRLYSIAVDPAAVGRGVASALLGAIERMASEKGGSTVCLEVREDNPVAIRLYERMGYRQFGRYENYYQDRMDALRFEKSLHPTDMENDPK